MEDWIQYMAKSAEPGSDPLRFCAFEPSVVTTAAVFTAAVVVIAATMLAAGVIVFMVMVIAAGVGIIGQGAIDQRQSRRIRITLHAAVQLDTGLSQRHLSTAADAAANEHIYLQAAEQARQRAVTAAIGGNQHLVGNLTVLHLIELELLGVTKVLENLSVLIGDGNDHGSFSFRWFKMGAMLPGTGMTAGCVAIAEAIVTTGNGQPLTGNEAAGHLVAGTFVDLGYRGAGDIHLGGAFWPQNPDR